MDREIDNKCCVYYHFILCVIAFILCLASIGLYLINAPYKTEDFKRRLKNWKTLPILSISYNNDYLNNLQKKLSQNDEEQLSKMFELKHMDKSYNYKHLLIEIFQIKITIYVELIHEIMDYIYQMELNVQ